MAYEYKFTGSRYAATKDMDIAAIAKLIRAEIKDAIKAGTFPKGLKTSVRISRYSGGQSLDVEIVSLGEGGLIVNPARVKLDRDDPHRRFSPYDIKPYSATAAKVSEAIGAMLNSYNFDDSDSMTDYFHKRFYGHVKFDWKTEKAEREAVLASGDFTDLNPHEEIAFPEPAPTAKRGVKLADVIPANVPAIPVFALYERPTA